MKTFNEERHVWKVMMRDNILILVDSGLKEFLGAQKRKKSDIVFAGDDL